MHIVETLRQEMMRQYAVTRDLSDPDIVALSQNLDYWIVLQQREMAHHGQPHRLEQMADCPSSSSVRED